MGILKLKDMEIRLSQLFKEKIDKTVDPHNTPLIKRDTKYIARTLEMPTVQITMDDGTVEIFANDLCHLRLDLN